MSSQKVTDQEVKWAIEREGGVRPAARALGVHHSTVQAHIRTSQLHPGRLEHRIEDGCILVGSDAHIWPGDPTTAMRGFRWAISQLAPQVIVLNGDVLDCATNSRYPGIGWESKPTLADELRAAQAQLADIEQLKTISGRLVWTLGNHDLRFETRLASVAPEYRDIQGIHLKDHFPAWEPAWSLWVNPGPGNHPLVVKHRFKGGINAPRNNTLHAGVSVATGHLHSLRVSPYSDYWGTRYGVDTGTLARPYGPQFTNYTEDNPVDWRAGFAVFTWAGGRLLMPELAQVHDEERGLIEFRGELHKV